MKDRRGSRSRLALTVEAIWYGRHPLRRLLAPLSSLYCLIAIARRQAYRAGWLESTHPGVPVVIVGNLTVGGTGKTPLVLWLAERLAAAGYRPGIVSRGYGGEAGQEPTLVTPHAAPEAVGDEPLLLARRSGCPVVVGRDRAMAASMLVEVHGCNLILTDDGLQHYRLARDLEIVVVDAQRLFGNGRCLPAGPLREPRSRLGRVDALVCNGGPCLDGFIMHLAPGAVVNLLDPDRVTRLDALPGRAITAVAGIGNSRRFFEMLEANGLTIDAKAYPDHHPFDASDIASWPSGAVLMTEKDAVKCAPYAGPDHWFVRVDAVIEPTFERWLMGRIERLVDSRLS